jgi:hypothetical protein
MARLDAMAQTVLADFAGMLSEMRENQKRILKAVERSRQVAAYYQADAANKAEALRLLKDERIRQHQAALYFSNLGRFAALRQHVYAFFRDEEFPRWDPARCPDGVYWKNIFLGAKDKPWCIGTDGATFRRRLNELADRHVTNPPLLTWTRPGYYVLALLEAWP